MTTKEEHYNSMMLAVQRYAPNADMDLVERAYRYADEKHKNQLRKAAAGAWTQLRVCAAK